MDIMEVAKATLYGILETAGKGGVSEMQAVVEMGKNGYHFGHYESISALKSVYKEMGLERTPEHTGQVICYYKSKREPEKKTSKAVELAKKLAQRTVNERTIAETINHYRR